jgi:hypothetical protein
MLNLVRNPWLAALVLFALGAGLLAATLKALGLETFPLLFGIVTGAGLVTALERLRARRHARRAAGRARSRASGDTPVTRAYDLRQDRSTDKQRWPM